MTETVHATALVLGTCGLLIRGPSGSGKSLLARDLIFAAEMRGEFAALISDDRVDLTVTGGRLVAHGRAEIAGLIEVRNRGLAATPYERSALIRAIVDFVPQGETARMPDIEEMSTEIMGLTLPRLKLAGGRRVPLDIVYRALREAGDGR